MSSAHLRADNEHYVKLWGRGSSDRPASAWRGFWHAVRMPIISWGAAAVFALVNWYGCARRRPGIAGAAKPLTLVALITAAWTMGAPDSTAGIWLLAALVLSLVGDGSLMSEAPPAFLIGLSAFLLAHVAYVVAFVLVGLARPLLGLVGVAVLAVMALVVGRHVVPGAHAGGGLGMVVAVVAYMVAIGAMAVTGWATGDVLLGLGGTVFVVSDSVLAWNRFVRPLPQQALIVMITYHAAQFLLVLGLLT